MKYLLLILLFTGCGVRVSVDPVEVNVNHRIDLQKLEQYCLDKCASEYTDVDEVKTCVNKCYKDFLDVFLLVGKDT